MRVNNKAFYNKAILCRDKILSVVELEGFTYRFPSEYNWINRQRGLNREKKLGLDRIKILNEVLPGWQGELSILLSEVRKTKIMEVAVCCNTEVGNMLSYLNPDDAYIYILARFGMDSIQKVLYIPCNFMFMRGEYFKSLGNYLYQRSEVGSIKLAQSIQYNIFNLAKRNNNKLTKELIAAYWFTEGKWIVQRCLGKNLYLFNFMAVASYQEHCGIRINDEVLKIDKNDNIVTFANKHKEILNSLCDSFMDKGEFGDIVKTKAFRVLYEDVYGITQANIDRESEIYHRVNKGEQRRIKRESIGIGEHSKGRILDKFRLSSDYTDYGNSGGLMHTHIKSAQGGDIVTGDEYNTGYTNNSSTGGDNRGHSIGQLVGVAIALDLIDIDAN